MPVAFASGMDKLIVPEETILSIHGLDKRSACFLSTKEWSSPGPRSKFEEASMISAAKKEVIFIIEQELVAIKLFVEVIQKIGRLLSGL